MKRGMGEHQKTIMKEARMKLLKVLGDGKWHQYKEIKNKADLSSATVSRHLKILTANNLLERDMQDKTYPPRVQYRIKESENFIAGFGIRLALHIREFMSVLGETIDQTEYLSILEEYFHNGIVSLLRHKKREKDLKAQEIDFMVHIFTQPLEPAIRGFIDRFGQKEKKT